MSYYHTYRPQLFSELAGQDAIRTVLTEAIKSDRLIHAYLFCGGRGTGKTTTARLLAKAMNCPQRAESEPCNSCELCLAITQGSSLDVIEIDAASNRGIEEIRQLQETIRFKPQQAAKKVVIIDEVHMLTKEAFNALLKTLEEPPSYLVFILATTEVHKLPATIISRCQRYDFSLPSITVLVEYLKAMATKEKLKFEGPALELIARLAKGSFRDAATLMEQLAGGSGELTVEAVTAQLGLPQPELVERFLNRLAELSDTAIFSDLSDYFQRGGNAQAFIDMSYGLLQEQLEAGRLVDKAAQLVAALTEIKQQLRYAPIGQLPVLAAIASDSSVAQLGLVGQGIEPVVSAPVAQKAPQVVRAEKAIRSDTTDKISDVSDSKTVVEPTPKNEEKAPLAEVLIVTPGDAKKNPEEFVTIDVAEQVPPVDLAPTDLNEKWQIGLAKLLEEGQSSLVSILRTAKPMGWNPPALTIGVQFKFHADQLVKQKNRDILETLFASLLGHPVRIDAEVMPTTDLASEAEAIFS